MRNLVIIRTGDLNPEERIKTIYFDGAIYQRDLIHTRDISVIIETNLSFWRCQVEGEQADVRINLDKFIGEFSYILRTSSVANSTMQEVIDESNNIWRYENTNSTLQNQFDYSKFIMEQFTINSDLAERVIEIEQSVFSSVRRTTTILKGIGLLIGSLFLPQPLKLAASTAISILIRKQYQP